MHKNVDIYPIFAEENLMEKSGVKDVTIFLFLSHYSTIIEETPRRFST